jgi:hypothetical protein
VPLPEDFSAALNALGEACKCYYDRTGSVAVLVGGAATAILTAGGFMSADFDVLAGRTQEFETILGELGFIQEDWTGYLRVGFYHPKHPLFGFQLVSGQLFDGKADYDKLLRFEITPRSEVVLPSVEDMIADRLGQYAAAAPSDTSRLEQAKTLLALAPKVERSYLFKRIREEGGDPSLLGLPSEGL